MPSSKNIESVNSLTDKIQNAKSIVFMDYRGVTASDENKLRKIVNSEQNVEYFVAKNRLFKLALQNSELSNEELEKVLKGPTSFIFSYDDVSLAPRLSKKFAEAGEDIFQIKGGIFEKKFVDASTVIAVSDLPSKEVLIARLLGRLMAPVQGLHNVLRANLTGLALVLKGVSEKK